MKLISMTDFVLENKFDKILDFNKKIIRYAKFLKQPLQLSFFIAVDANNKPMNRIEWRDSESSINFHNNNLLLNHLEKECFFKNFQFDKFGRLSDSKGNTLDYNKIMNSFDGDFKTVEDLVKLKPELTPTAIKQIQP